MLLRNGVTIGLSLINQCEVAFTLPAYRRLPACRAISKKEARFFKHNRCRSDFRPADDIYAY